MSACVLEALDLALVDHVHVTRILAFAKDDLAVAEGLDLVLPGDFHRLSTTVCGADTMRSESTAAPPATAFGMPPPSRSRYCMSACTNSVYPSATGSMIDTLNA